MTEMTMKTTMTVVELILSPPLPSSLAELLPLGTRVCVKSLKEFPAEVKVQS